LSEVKVVLDSNASAIALAPLSEIRLLERLETSINQKERTEKWESPNPLMVIAAVMP
jgi:hypothetical protein